MIQISVDPDHYLDDIRSLIQPIINKHGMEEWRAGVLTNEIHGHVGIYALVGMKMGILAKEYFSAKGDDMHIRSFAGRTPPVSCMNDGLQVSTGSSLGHGLITVEDTNEQQVAAVFALNGDKQRFALNEDIAEKISKDIRFGVKTYGLSSNEYWEHVRKLALQYWLELDRHNIFTISKAD
jgi:pyrimidine-specific ribonucleoside hydrolase